MLRRLATAGAVLLLATSTLAIVGAAWNWPPPLLVLRYGLPGSQGPTGRVAVVEGATFDEFAPGYFFVSPWTMQETLRGIRRFQGVIFPNHGASRRDRFYLRLFGAHPHWIELPETVWLANEELIVWETRTPEGPATRLPIRHVRGVEGFVVLPVDLPPEPRFGCSHDDLRRPSMAFTLAPGEESLVEPYLVSGE